MTDFVDKVVVYDPRINFSRREYIIEKGGESVTPTSTPATSFSPTNWNFTVSPNGRNVSLDREILLYCPVTITMTGPGDGSGQLMFQRNRDAFRARPLSSIISTISMKVNSYNLNMELSDGIVHLLDRFHNSMQSQHIYNSLFPSACDNYSEYSDGDAQSVNVLGEYGDSFMTGRGAYPINIISNTNTSCVLTSNLVEPLILPPLIFSDKYYGPGLIGLDTLEFQFILSQNLARIMTRSRSNTVPITNLSVVFGIPTLYTFWITPKMVDYVMPIPKINIYPNFTISKYTSMGPTTTILDTMNPNSIFDPFTITSQVIQFNTFPRKIYVFIRDIDPVGISTIYQSDTYYSIDRIRVSLDNNDGLLTGATQQHLYKMTRNNGCNIPYIDWVGTTQRVGQLVSDPNPFVQIGLTGSLLCIEAKDLSLSSTLAPGVLDKLNFQIVVTAHRINRNLSVISTPVVNTLVVPSQPQLYIIGVYEGILKIFDNTAETQTVVTAQDVLSAKVDTNTSIQQLEHIYGGDFFGKVKEHYERFKPTIQKINKGLRDTQAISKTLGVASNVLEHIPFASSAAPYVNDASKLANLLGYGDGGCDMYSMGGAVAGRRRMKKRMSRR